MAYRSRGRSIQPRPLVETWRDSAAPIVGEALGQLGAWNVMAANGFTEEDLKKGSPAVIFGVSAVFCLLMAATLLHIKSKLLLPVHEDEEGDEDGGENECQRRRAFLEGDRIWFWR